MMSAIVVLACRIAFAGSAVQITRLQCDAPRNDHVTTNSEYVVFKNTTGKVTRMGGFKVFDKGRIHAYKFPRGFKLGARKSVTLYSGRGRNGGGKLYWGSGSAIRNNTGDTATLIDRRGRVLDRHDCSDV